MKFTGEICLDYINDALNEIKKLSSTTHQIIIIRSTSVSGSTDTFAEKYPSFRIIFCPEFLTEAHPTQDALNTNRVVIGANSEEDFNDVRGLFQLAYGDKVPYIHLTRKEAETLKYMSNVHLFAQVMISNELYFICEKIGINYDKIQQLLQFDHRIGTHRKVPGPDGDFGAGGKCLIKDSHAFAFLSRMHGYSPYLLEEMLRFNDHIRRTKDWLDIPGAVKENANYHKSFNSDDKF
jgi:nucleotide sugar dehydrogenase